MGGHSIIVALGGNALQPENERGDIHQQFAHTRESLGAIVSLAREGWRIAVVHGNGPQIGDELLRNELARAQMPPLPLGVLVAATAGWIGYMIQQSLQNAFERAGITRPVVALIAQVLVESGDARAQPSKPVGRFMEEAQAELLRRELGWTMRETPSGWRRVVPSPIPTAVVEAAIIRQLVEQGVIVICIGGGGTPVYRDPVLRLEGVDAVIDKDRAAAVLGAEIGAEALLILTNVEGAYRDFGTPAQRLLRRLTVADAEGLLAGGEFAAGSMGPKIEAAIAFLRSGGRYAHVARLDQGLEAVRGAAGTMIVAA